MTRTTFHVIRNSCTLKSSFIGDITISSTWLLLDSHFFDDNINHAHTLTHRDRNQWINKNVPSIFAYARYIWLVNKNMDINFPHHRAWNINKQGQQQQSNINKTIILCIISRNHEVVCVCIPFPVCTFRTIMAYYLLI